MIRMSEDIQVRHVEAHVLGAGRPTIWKCGDPTIWVMGDSRSDDQVPAILMQSNNKKEQKKRYGLLRENRDLQWLLQESLDLQNNHKGLSFHNIQHVYSLSRVTLK
jgi:hypothetical protein